MNEEEIKKLAVEMVAQLRLETNDRVKVIAGAEPRFELKECPPYYVACNHGIPCHHGIQCLYGICHDIGPRVDRRDWLIQIDEETISQLTVEEKEHIATGIRAAAAAAARLVTKIAEEDVAQLKKAAATPAIAGRQVIGRG